jgi:hypothetical protein
VGDNYKGDLLFRLDPYGRTLQALEVPVHNHGQASLAASPAHGLLYGEAADPIKKDKGEPPGPFFAYDPSDQEIIFEGAIEPHVGFRSILVDEDGVAYWSIGGGELQTYDPATGHSTTHGWSMPGDWLRAVTAPSPDGSVYGVTREPDVFFVMGPDGEITNLGEALGYTASIALTPDGSAFFYMPGAHGNSSEWSSAVMSVDTASGEQKVVVELYDLIESSLGYRIGGTYNVAVTPDGEQLFLGVNASKEPDESFGEVLLLIIELP